MPLGLIHPYIELHWSICFLYRMYNTATNIATTVGTATMNTTTPPTIGPTVSIQEQIV